jgi:hypothetical protein
MCRSVGRVQLEVLLRASKRSVWASGASNAPDAPPPMSWHRIGRENRISKRQTKHLATLFTYPGKPYENGIGEK